MRHYLWALSALAVLNLASPAQAADNLATLYAGGAPSATGLTIGGWGSGTAKESKDEAYSGATSLLMTSDGYYAGGRIDFAQPVDLSRFASEPQAALRFRVKFPSASFGGDTGMFGMATGALVPGGGERLLAQVPMPGGPGGPGMPGMPPGMIGRPGYNPIGTVQDGPTPPPTQTMRFVLMGDAVRAEAAGVPVDVDSAQNEWISITAPLSAFHTADETPADWKALKVKRLLVFGDAKDSFYIGEIAVIRNPASITQVSAGEDHVVAINDVIEFKSEAVGPAGMRFAWDFDDKDGIQEEAIGRDVTYRYRKAGIYKVTLTVSDPFKVAKPATATCQVEVTG